ncbi:hypothetical protein DPMN_190226 [Dreissena polymorpha]|uniref:Uncharacterized protein n=1 Tax=Dreissena polymorpha TaxID=45954 RepID=A0A9D4IBJ3_DREPO|nr:hypothetical protein DPMN_190226 [Dreissena polymorpha]
MTALIGNKNEPGLIETVINGNHYERTLTGMLIVKELIHKLEWQAFWTHKDKATYPVLEHMKKLQNILVSNQRCPEQFDDINEQMEQLHQYFFEFQKECEAKSELCQFFGVWLQLVSIVKNALVSDREKKLESACSYH